MNKPVRDEIIKCLWFGSHFLPDRLELQNGETVNVLSPGWWNVEEGPSFINGAIESSNGTFKTNTPYNIECWSNLSDVPKNPDCDLIVVFWNDSPQVKIDTPVIVLSNACEEEVEELVDLFAENEG